MMIWALGLLTVNAQDKLPLKLISTTAMPGFTGDFDHFGLDLRGNRLFLAAEEHKTVEVFDLRTGARIHSIEGFGHPLMMAYVPRTNQLVVTDGDEDSGVRLVDCEQYKVIKTVKLRPEVDHGVLDPRQQYYYAESGGGSNGPTHVLSIVDIKSFKHVGDVEGLPGSSNEGMTIDRAGKRLYVNLTGADEVGVVNLKTRHLVARWPLPDAHTAHAIALDEANHRLFVAARKPALFIVFDTDTGKVVASLPCVGGNSDMSFDVVRKRIYVTGSETASVFEQETADHYKHIAEVPTAYRAKSSIFVPELNRLYIAVSGKGKPDATLELRIYEVQ
jgi:DNA-binding beta-propeller fold protein YncE